MGIVKNAVFSLFHFPGSSPKDCPREIFILCCFGKDTSERCRLAPTLVTDVTKQGERLQPRDHSMGNPRAKGSVGLGCCWPRMVVGFVGAAAVFSVPKQEYLRQFVPSSPTSTTLCPPKCRKGADFFNYLCLSQRQIPRARADE